MTPRLERARGVWREILETLRHEPITDASKLVDEMIEDLNAMFPVSDESPRGTGPTRKGQ